VSLCSGEDGAMTEQMAELLKVSLGLWNLKNMER